MIFICIYLVVNDTENFPVLNGHLCIFLCVVSIKSYTQLYCVSFNKQKGRKRGRKAERKGGEGREERTKKDWLLHQATPQKPPVASPPNGDLAPDSNFQV